MRTFPQFTAGAVRYMRISVYIKGLMKPQCYGNIFPDFAGSKINQSLRGRVFSTLIQSVGIGIQSRSSKVDLEQWENCTECEHYRTCYDLSLGQLLVSMAIGQTLN
jgi:hypothetical protein